MQQQLEEEETYIQRIKTYHNTVKNAYSKRFISTITSMYFLQGFRSYSYTAVPIWFFYNYNSSSHTQIQLFLAILSLSWCLKFLYRLIIESGIFQLYGLKDKPYLVITSILTTIGFAIISFPDLLNYSYFNLLLFWIALSSLSFTDVVSDMMVVETSQTKGDERALQYLCFIMLNSGNIIGKTCAAFTFQSTGLGSRWLLLIYSCLAFLTIIPTLFLKGTRANQLYNSNLNDNTTSPYSPESNNNNTTTTTTYLAAGKVFLKECRFIWKGIWCKRILRPLGWIFFSFCIVPEVSPTLTVFKLDELGIGADIQAIIDIGADLFALFILYLFSNYLAGTNFRRVFFWTQFGMCFVFICDSILVNKWHQSLKIPDVCFVAAYTVIGVSFKMVMTISVLRLLAQLTPLNAGQGAFYGFLTSITNLSTFFGTLFGGILMPFVQLTNIMHLRVLIAVSTLLFIYLVPKSVEPVEFEDTTEVDAGSAAPEMTLRMPEKACSTFRNL